MSEQLETKKPIVPVFIVTYNLLTTTQKTVEEVKRLGGVPVIIDNNSIYPPLLRWYETRPALIFSFEKNYGPLILKDRIDYLINLFTLYTNLVPTHIIISDCDCDLSKIPDDGIEKLIKAAENTHYRKIGFGIELNEILAADISEEQKKRIRDMEEKYWREKIIVNGISAYKAPIDTTFCLFLKDRPGDWYGPGLRLDYPYVMRHEPWYWNPENLTEEQKFFIMQLKTNGTLRQTYFSGWFASKIN